MIEFLLRASQECPLVRLRSKVSCLHSLAVSVHVLLLRRTRDESNVS